MATQLLETCPDYAPEYAFADEGGDIHEGLSNQPEREDDDE